MNDPVNHPVHYTNGGVECLDAIKAACSATKDGYEGFLSGQVIKYVWRYNLKWNPEEDLDKARFYLDKLIAYKKEQSEHLKQEKLKEYQMNNIAYTHED